MTDIHSFSEVAPEFLTTVIPISFYEQDEAWVESKLESGNFVYPIEYEEEPDFVKMVIPIEAYEKDEFLSYRGFDPEDFMPMVGSHFPTPNNSPGQPGAIM